VRCEKKTKINVKTLRICKRCQSTEVKSKKLLIVTSESKEKENSRQKKLKKTTQQKLL